MSKFMFQMFVLALFVSTGAVAGFAQNAAPATETVNVVKPAGEQPAMTEEQKAKMAMMKKYSSVNENHKFLESLAGTWNTKVQFWMDPSGEPEASEGISEGKIIMGGRFLEQTYNGTAMGQPFEGRGLIGYDNLKKEYTTIWFDNMSTGIMTGSGQYNPESNIMVTEGSMSCPLTQEIKRWYRDVMTFTDVDNYTYETYMRDQRGVEYKSMVVAYSRAK